MRRSKDQKDLQAILLLAHTASDAAYDLFSRRLDTRRNVESFMLLGDAVNLLEKACAALRQAQSKAGEPRARGQLGALDELLASSGGASLVDGSRQSTKPQSACVVLRFPGKK